MNDEETNPQLETLPDKGSQVEPEANTGTDTVSTTATPVPTFTPDAISSTIRNPNTGELEPG